MARNSEQLSLQQRIDRLGLTDPWRQVRGWAEAGGHLDALEGIVATLEYAEAARFMDDMERIHRLKIEVRAKDDVRNLRAIRGKVKEAQDARAELLLLFDRIGLDPLPLRWSGKEC